MMSQVSGDRTPITSDLVKQDESFADIVQEFVEALPNRVSEIEAALNGQDFNSLRTLAHRLKGSGGGYGYAILTEKAARLEKLAVQQELDKCAAAVDELKNIVSRVMVS